MKNISKKCFSIILAVAVFAGTIGTHFLGTMNQVEAAANPAYMAKVVGTGGRLWHAITPEANATYTFTCNYYAKTESTTPNAQIRFFSNLGDQTVGSGEFDGKNTGYANRNKVCTLTVKYTATTDTWLSVRIDNQTSNADYYFWNIKVTKGDGTENILNNADFTQGNGSWHSWQMSDYQSGDWIDGETMSQAATEATGHTILPYDPEIYTFLPNYASYQWDNTAKTLIFAEDFNFDLSTITNLQLQQEGKFFVGWKNQNDEWLTKNMLNGYDFSEGDTITAQYLDYNPNVDGDFAIRTEEIRTNSKLGIRFVVELSNDLMEQLPGAGEYGTIVLPTEILDANSWADLTYDGSYDYNDETYNTKVVKAEKIYQTLEERIYYTLCITDLTEEKYDRQYTVKGYIKYTDYNGVEQVLYTNYASTNAYLVATEQLSQTNTSDEDTIVISEIVQYVKNKYQLIREQLEEGKTDFVGSSENPKGWIYQLTNGIRVREVNIETGKDGDEVEIMHLSDLHYNYLSALDFAEANPTLLSTYEKRTWGKDGAFAPVARKLLTYAQAADQVVITGDVLDYLSHGTVEMMNREIWDKYPNTMIALGNHEPVQQMQGTVGETLTGDARMQWIESVWKHDPYYSSKLVGNKVVVVQLHNGENKFLSSQIEKLRNDINSAKKNGYIVLLFMHESLSTGNSADTNVAAIRSEATGAGVQGDTTNRNFYDMNSSTTGNVINIHPDIDDATEQVYNLITNNADVIKGVFNGHVHSSYYTEIQAKNSDGTDAIIPQYTISSGAFDDGYAIKIKVK